MIPNRMKLAWVDTETTGLDPVEGARVIEVAVIVTDMDLNPIGDAYQTRIDLPDGDWARANPRALEVNGFSKEQFRAEGVPLASEEVWRPVQKLTNGAVLAGQNVPFDEKMLVSEFARFGMAPTWNTRRRHEMMFVCNQVGDLLGLSRWGLHEVYDALGGPKLPEHQAHSDLLRCHYIYRLQREAIVPVFVAKALAAQAARAAAATG